MKHYLFTDANIEEVLRLIRKRSYTEVRDYLQQLPETESQSLKEDEDARGRRSEVKEIKRSPSPTLVNETASKKEGEQDNPASSFNNSKDNGGLKDD